MATTDESSLLNKLNQGRRIAPIPDDLQRILARLKNGQKWLVENGIQESSDQADVFQKSYDEWDRLEQETRNTWAYSGCVIGPGGCHKDAPIQCDSCSGRPPPEPRVMICTRDGARSSTTTKQGNQAALFETGGKSHYE